MEKNRAVMLGSFSSEEEEGLRRMVDRRLRTRSSSRERDSLDAKRDRKTVLFGNRAIESENLARRRAGR